MYFYWDMALDIYSRKIVGHEVHATESAEQAALLTHEANLAERLTGREVVLHSDNGSSMKGATILATLGKLGIMPSFSRPRVSNDNAYAEPLSKTSKYRPDYPSAFSAPNWTPSPRQTGHLVQRKLDTHSTTNWTSSPAQTGQFEAA